MQRTKTRRDEDWEAFPGCATGMIIFGEMCGSVEAGGACGFLGG
jgi:hypothetical protein